MHLVVRVVEPPTTFLGEHKEGNRCLAMTISNGSFHVVMLRCRKHQRQTYLWVMCERQSGETGRSFLQPLFPPKDARGGSNRVVSSYVCKSRPLEVHDLTTRRP